VAQPGVAPAHHRSEYRIEIEPLLGEAVLDTSVVTAAAHAIEDSIADQVAQPRAQYVARDTRPLLKLVEAMAAEKCLAQNQHGPSLANHRQRARDRAVHRFDRVPSHLRFKFPQGEFHARHFPKGRTRVDSFIVAL